MALVPLLLFLLLHRKLNLLLSLSLPFYILMISNYLSHRALYSGSVPLNKNQSDTCKLFCFFFRSFTAGWVCVYIFDSN